MVNSEWYYETNGLIKFLRFFNLLEPDRHVISISKVLMWVSVIILILALIFMRENLVAIIGTVTTAFGAGANYAWRRHVAYKNELIGKQTPENVT